MRQVVLDTETTGINPQEGHRIIEIGCVELIGRKLTGHNYHTHLNPEREIDEDATRVHGFTWAMLKEKPLFSKVAEAFLSYVSGSELLIHNAPFDVGFIDAELEWLNQALGEKRYGKLADYCSIFDTLAFARQRHPGQRNSLDALCKRYQVDNTWRTLHGALLDAQILADVYLKMTGGQTTLFSSEESATNCTLVQAKINGLRRLNSNRPALKVIQPKPEELIAHQAKLVELELVAGQCLWLAEQLTEHPSAQEACRV